MLARRNQEHAGDKAPVVGVLVRLRAAVRYPLTGDVLFMCEEEQGVQLKAEGVTRDVSAQGVFVYSMALPRQNSQVRMEVAFPPLCEGASPVRIGIRGRVVRIESSEGSLALSGFAAAGEGTILPRGEHCRLENKEGVKDFPGPPERNN
jgi:PilZ domain